MLSVLSTSLSWVISSIGTVLTALTGTSTADGALEGLLPLVGIAFGLAMVGFVFSLIKRLTWGA